MTLNKRILLAIFPVIFLSNLLAGLYFLRTQETAVLDLERSRLSLQASNLQSLFQSQVDFNRNFLQSVVGNEALRLYLQEDDDAYRMSAIGNRLVDTIRNLTVDTGKFASVAVFKPDLTLAYYFENSDDPFAEASVAQKDYARRLFAGDQTNAWGLMKDDKDRWMIINSQFIVPATHGTPMPNHLSEAVLVQTVVKLERFVGFRKKVERDFQTRVEFTSDIETRKGPISAHVQLGPKLFLSIIPPKSYIEQKMMGQRAYVVACVSTISILSVLLLIFLMRHYIAEPVADLDRQVTGVMNGNLDSISPAPGNGEISHLSANVKQMYDNLKASLQRIQRMSWIDSLTGIHNRAFFTAEANRRLEDAARQNTAYRLFFIDLDNFKFVNDRFGHNCGDTVLEAFAQRITALLDQLIAAEDRQKVVFARLSGDEFAVLIPDAAAESSQFAHAVLQIFARGFEVDGQTYPVTASIGCACFPEDAVSLGDLVSRADTAMYQAKDQGKNAWTRYSAALEEKTNRQRQILAELRIADLDAELHLVYMPIADQDGKIPRCEALLRWTSAVLGSVSPAEFIPVAESNGLFSTIDYWVIDHAIADLPRLRSIYGEDLILSINLSSAELHNPDLAQRLEQRVRRLGVEPASIELELTETVSASSSRSLTETLLAMRSAGFKISIDDFGAGYTSLQQIMDYPADTVKLDMAIVRKLAVPGQARVLENLIGMCHARGMSVVAEGVDTAAKLDILQRAGCDLFQGYLISKPMNLDDLAASRLDNFLTPLAADLRRRV